MVVRDVELTAIARVRMFCGCPLSRGQGCGDDDGRNDSQGSKRKVYAPFRALAVRIDVDVRHEGSYFPEPDEASAFRLECRRSIAWAHAATSSDTATNMASAVT